MSGPVFSLNAFFLVPLKKAVRLFLPLRLLRRRTYAVPTGYGVVFFFMLLALLLGSINHNNNLGYILTFLLGSMALVSIFHTFRNLSGLEVVSARAAPVFAGQKAVFQVSILVPRRKRPGVALYFPEGDVTAVSLQEPGMHIVPVTHDAGERGVLEPAILFMETSYPFNLFRVRSPVPVDFSCLVYPQPVAGPFVTADGPSDDEVEGETGGLGVEDFSSLVPYQSGDPLQHISWKTYSRGQGLHTKKFEGQQGKTLYFDPEVLSGQDMELKLSRICSMIIKADALRLSYGLKLGGNVIAPGSGGSHKRLCLKELALFGK